VEVEADLEAQGVAGAEPGGLDARFEQRAPERRRVFRRAEKLDA
jgi:hypothetical protein